MVQRKRSRHHGHARWWRLGTLSPAGTAVLVIEPCGHVLTRLARSPASLAVGCHRGPARLWPYAIVGSVWAALYLAGEHGVVGSGLYLDPRHATVPFCATFHVIAPDAGARVRSPRPRRAGIRFLSRSRAAAQGPEGLRRPRLPERRDRQPPRPPVHALPARRSGHARARRPCRHDHAGPGDAHDRAGENRRPHDRRARRRGPVRRRLLAAVATAGIGHATGDARDDGAGLGRGRCGDRRRADAGDLPLGQVDRGRVVSLDEVGRRVARAVPSARGGRASDLGRGRASAAAVPRLVSSHSHRR
jgi:hypothetical protein